MFEDLRAFYQYKDQYKAVSVIFKLLYYLYSLFTNAACVFIVEPLVEDVFGGVGVLELAGELLFWSDVLLLSWLFNFILQGKCVKICTKEKKSWTSTFYIFDLREYYGYDWMKRIDCY